MAIKNIYDTEISAPSFTWNGNTIATQAWVNANVGTPTLDAVTTVGNTTTNSIEVGPAFYVGRNISTTSAFAQLGHGRTGNGYAYVDLVGDATYTDYGLRMLRGNGGANTWSEIVHRGTGAFAIETNEAAPIQFKTSNAERMRILPAGQVAIGRTTAFTVGGTATLSVNGDLISWGNSSTDLSYFRRLSAGNYQWQTYNGGNAGNIHLQPYGGSIGIGTTSPASKLHVVSSAYDVMRIERSSAGGGVGLYLENGNNNTWIIGNGGNDHFAINKSTSNFGDEFIIQSTGEVGIGTTSPLQKLDVDGNIQILDTNAIDGDIFGYLNFHSTNGGSSGNHARIAAIRDSVSEGQMLFYTKIGGAATEKMRITSGGNVGIGTTSPSSNLHIAASYPVLKVDGSTHSAIHIDRGSTSYDANLLFQTAGSTKFRVWLDAADALGIRDEANATEMVTFKSGGNVGIGTTSPHAELVVNGKIDTSDTSNGAFRIYDGSTFRGGWGTGDWAGVNFGDSSSDLVAFVNGSNKYFIGTNSQPRLTVDGSGNVGIGTTSPAGKLHIKTNASSEFIFTGSSTSGYATTLHMDDTGLDIGHNSTSRSLNLKTGSLDRLTITGGGNVGIGTTSPDRKLHVYQGDSGVTGYALTNGIDIESTSISGINILSPDTGNGRIYFGSPSSSTSGAVEYVHSATLSSAHMKFRAGNAERMRIDGSGKVGIGNTSPDAKLSINTTAAQEGIKIRNVNSIDTFHLGHLSTEDSYLQMKNNAGTIEVLLRTDNGNSYINTGNVGIGTTSPAQKLHVDQGFIRVQSPDVGGVTPPYVQIGQLTNAYQAGVSSYYHLQLRAGGSGNIYFTEDGNYLMMLSNAGNLGIGTTSPSAKLHVSDVSTDILTESTTGAARNILKSSTGEWRLGTNAGQSNNFWIYEPTLAQYVFNIDTSGNVGIGTTSPAGALHVQSSSTKLFLSNTDYNNATSTGSGMILQTGASSGNTYGQIYAFQSGNTAYANLVVPGGNVGIGTTSPAQKLDVVGAARSTYNSSNYSQLESNASGGVFKALAAGATNILLRSYGDSYFNGGNLGVGTSNPSEKLEVSGNILASGDITAFSDARIKENVETLPNALESVKAMRGVTYNKIGEEKQSIGVIAQEVQAVLPQLVSEHKDEMLSVAYGNITAVLIEAIKEQQEQIDELKAIINGLTK